MTFLEDLYIGLKEQLAPIDAHVVLGPTPQRGDALGIGFYSVDDNSGLTDSVQGMQITVRADGERSNATPALADQVFDLLDGQTLTEWNGILIARCWRNSSADLGQDDRKRYVRTENYYLQLTRSTAHRSDS